MKHVGQNGFTLIELLVIISIIGILGSLGLSSFSVYRASAAYSVAETTVQSARTSLEASLNDIDNPPSAVPLTTQTQQGNIQGAEAAAFLEGLKLPKNTKFSVSYDPTCTNAACQSESLEASHCFSEEHIRWVRFGDGVDVLLEHVAGGGCS